MAINLFAPIADKRLADKVRAAIAKLKHRDDEPHWLDGLLLVVIAVLCGAIIFPASESARKSSQSAWTGPAVPVARYAVTVKQVHDGDTLQATIHLPLGVDLRDQVIRAADFDAWEITRARTTVGKITDDELAKGKLAKTALQDLLNSGSLWMEFGDKRDAYGRILAKWFVVRDGNTVFVAEWMTKNGHVRQ